MPVHPRGGDRAVVMGDLSAHRDMNAQEIADQDLVTTVLRLSEILSAGISPERAGRPRPVPHFATPEDHDEQTLPHDFREFSATIRQISHLMTHDPKLAHQAAYARGAFGDGEVLKILFRRLFPGQHGFRYVNPDGSPILTVREVEVLRETAGDIGHEEIAQRLKVSPRTVSTHLNNIYKKLNVQRPMQAVARAISMGYLDTNVLDVIEAAGNNSPRNFRLFDTVATNAVALSQPMFDRTLRPLTEFALLLLVVAGRAANVLQDAPAVMRACKPGAVCVLDSQGKIVRMFGREHLVTPGGIAVIPERAARQGFTPGNILVSHYASGEIGLNETLLSEFEPDGHFLRSFAGGREIGTRIVGGKAAFHPDGRLLLSSGNMTDAILVFRRGGATVRRFAEIICAGIAVNSEGTIYAINGSAAGNSIRVFSATGKRMNAFGLTEAGSGYQGIAIGTNGSIWVKRYNTANNECALQEFSPDGELRRTLPILGMEDVRYLTIDKADHIYVPCPRNGHIKVVSPEGKILRTIDLHGKIRPASVALSESGLLYVTGAIP